MPPVGIFGVQIGKFQIQTIVMNIAIKFNRDMFLPQDERAKMVLSAS